MVTFCQGTRDIGENKQCVTCDPYPVRTCQKVPNGQFSLPESDIFDAIWDVVEENDLFSSLSCLKILLFLTF